MYLFCDAQIIISRICAKNCNLKSTEEIKHKATH